MINNRSKHNTQRRRVTTVIIGAGQAGLAMSRCLSNRSIDHVILERGEIANSWRKERWDSLCLLSPNWQNKLPDFQYQGSDPDGFMAMPELIKFFSDYAQTISAPVHCGVTVTAVYATQSTYQIISNDGEWECDTLVIASGSFNIPVIPKVSQSLPGSIESLSCHQYKNPNQLSKGGVIVVGGSATGLQLADEIHRSGRPVTLCVGEHVRMPRQYRGHDILWWLDKSGRLSERYDEVDDINRARKLPSSQLAGSATNKNLSLNQLYDNGIKLVGRLTNIHNSKAQFSGSLKNVCKLADLKMKRMLDLIDQWARQQGMEDQLKQKDFFPPSKTDSSPQLELNLSSGEIESVIWATGFRPDYSWLKVPVLDNKGGICHDGGVVSAPGLYVMGLPFMRRRNSSFIGGVSDDAEDLSEHLANYVHQSYRSHLVSVA